MSRLRYSGCPCEVSRRLSLSAFVVDQSNCTLCETMLTHRLKFATFIFEEAACTRDHVGNVHHVSQRNARTTTRIPTCFVHRRVEHMTDAPCHAQWWRVFDSNSDERHEREEIRKQSSTLRIIKRGEVSLLIQSCPVQVKTDDQTL